MVVRDEFIHIQNLEFTPIEEIEQTTIRVRDSFLDLKTRSIDFRKKQLRKLYWVIHDNQHRIDEALARDLGRPSYESYVSETSWMLQDILFIVNNLDKWSKDENAPDIPWGLKSMAPKIRKDPMGSVLIIGACNYPFQLSFSPLFGAIAAGNTVVLKPSEQTPNSAVVMKELFEMALDRYCFAIVQGGVTEVQTLLASKWDKIFFTGSQAVGRIVLKAAAQHLTPVVLELGGLNPAIVTRKANPRIVARRLLWAKTLNAGQTCTAHNYILIERSILPAVVKELKRAYSSFYPKGSKDSADYTRIVSDTAFQRLKSMLDDSRGKLVLGGTVDEKDRYIEQTFIQVDSLDDSMIVNEAFGPICAIVPVNDVDEAIKVARKVQDTTLGAAVFGDANEQQKVMAGLRSGSVSLNDAQPHISTLAFGGVGESGFGAYRGRSSFDIFVHRRPYTNTPSWVETLLDIRYPPYSTWKLRMYNLLFEGTPDFDRAGYRSISIWLRYILWNRLNLSITRIATTAISECILLHLNLEAPSLREINNSAFGKALLDFMSWDDGPAYLRIPPGPRCG